MSIDSGKVLICDDSILARKQIKDIISIVGNPTILEASDGEGAIEMYKAHKPNLVFLDIVMPKKDGNIAIEEIMAFEHKAPAPPIAQRYTPPNFPQASATLGSLSPLPIAAAIPNS